jgi:hypothetical protein
MEAPQQPISFAPEACASLSFLSIFGPMLGLAPLPRDDLERCLREPGVYRQLIEMQWQMMQPNAPCPAGDAWYAELRTVVAKGVVVVEPALAERVASAGYAELSDHDRLAVLLALCEAVAPAVDPQDLGGPPQLLGQDPPQPHVGRRSLQPERRRAAGQQRHRRGSVI